MAANCGFRQIAAETRRRQQEIWGHDLVSGVDFQITNLPGRAKTTPRIWGDKVYVHMCTTTGGYMFDIPAH